MFTIAGRILQTIYGSYIVWECQRKLVILRFCCQGTFWWYISWLFSFGSFSRNHIRKILLEVMGSKKAPNLTFLVILNYILSGTVIFSCRSYITLSWKKNRFRLVFDTLLSALKRCYIHMYIFLEKGKLTCSLTWPKTILYISI